MATFNSHTNGAVKYAGFIAGMWLLLAGMARADEASNQTFVARAAGEFNRARVQFQSHTNDATAAWQFARACFDFADFASNDTQRADIAGQGISASRVAIAREPKSVFGHYYLAMDLGQLARTELLGALQLVKDMEREFKTAATLEERFDFGGPARNLGLLYRDAPGWPTSLGSKHKARQYLEQAVKLAPNYPENHLNLIESYLQWKERDTASQEMKVLDALWPQAQTNLTGVAWEQSWADWSTRRNLAHKQLSTGATARK